MSNHGSRAKTLIITEDEEELNPFSFREFLRSKKHDPDPDLVLNPEQDLGLDQQQPEWKVSLLQEATSCVALRSLSNQVEKREGGWSFQSVEDSSSLCAEDEEEGQSATFFSKRGGGATYEGDDEVSRLQPNTSSRGRIQQLQQENRSLRRTIMDLQRTSEADKQRVEALEAELQQRRCQEQQEVRDMENMVHSVEQNLELMTKRALRAEGSACRMRAELQLLQVTHTHTHTHTSKWSFSRVCVCVCVYVCVCQAEIECLRSENASLKSGESEVIAAMRRNAHVASDYLDKTASHAHSSIRQLLEGAESLRLVSQLLRSIDSVSDVTSGEL
ncbi:endosome-associated-trafficking regulator 1 isoform X3 [Dunckerocampus dactyliophorus]|uniref:endosome-associated-trafficking regulator 1 isoform X3 n=1 Tax=Dunckerocampus dactyliophorus TaxID=161453 RepID=UPI002405EF14|nr:endosome-associated-trafficking regulator 1 isoform X3 [Dunckerocampus dactyliophorus]